MPTVYIQYVWRLPLKDFGLTAPQVTLSTRGFWWNKDHLFSIFVLLCYTISSIMHAEIAAIFVCLSRVLQTDSLSTDPGRTCWSQGWSSRSSDHPSDCQSQSSSRRTCPLTEQMWSSVLRSNPQNSHWKTEFLLVNERTQRACMPETVV